MAADSPAPPPARYWTVLLVRAIVALVPTIIITFTPDLHTAEFGLLVFGGFAIVAALLPNALAWRRVADRGARTLIGVQAIIGLVAGILALALAGSGLGLYLYLTSVWAVLTGFLEVVAAVRARRNAAEPWRDWLVAGISTVILAVVFVLIPAQAKLAIGIFGVYTVVLCVFLAISAFSLKWGTGYATRVRAVAGSGS